MGRQLTSITGTAYSGTRNNPPPHKRSPSAVSPGFRRYRGSAPDTVDQGLAKLEVMATKLILQARIDLSRE